jgi:formylglycine-generating enzyme required for sulfatase activity
MTPALIRRGALLALVATGILSLALAPAESPLFAQANGGAAPLGTAAPYPGMVEIPAGPFPMGIDQRPLVKQFRNGSNQKRWHPKLLGQDGDFLWWLLLCETPEHEANTEAYAMGRYCVTNAQYEAFLKDTAQKTVWISGARRTITDVGVEIFGENVPPEVLEQIYWLNSERLDQLKARVYADNEAIIKAVLEAFNVGRRRPVQNFDDLPDAERVGAWVSFHLPEDTALVVYTRQIPKHWPKGAVSDEIAALPVVWVSAKDADDFAEWAGMHVPTEAEWACTCPRRRSGRRRPGARTAGSFRGARPGTP